MKTSPNLRKYWIADIVPIDAINKYMHLAKDDVACCVEFNQILRNSSYSLDSQTIIDTEINKTGAFSQ